MTSDKNLPLIKESTSWITISIANILIPVLDLIFVLELIFYPERLINYLGIFSKQTQAQDLGQWLGKLILYGWGYGFMTDILKLHLAIVELPMFISGFVLAYKIINRSSISKRLKTVNITALIIQIISLTYIFWTIILGK